LLPPPPRSTLFPYTTLFRSVVFFHAERRNFRDLAVKLLVFERFDDDARGLADINLADVGLVHFAEHVNARNVAERHDQRGLRAQDRKSTRLNSSHVAISYAV